MEDKKKIVQVAGRVLESISGLRRGRYLELTRRLATFVGQLQELATESRKMGLSVTRGWFSAADRCRNRVNRLLSDMSYHLGQLKHFAESPQKQDPSLATLVAELKQVQDEFGHIEFDAGGDTVCIVTDPITLDDIPLGPFKIELQLGRIGELYKCRPYRIIAVNPNPAATDDGVTHPHVSGENLCEGDGAAAITASLEDGRLCDFFTMVRSILTTYNSDSPYVSLDDWDGAPCYDCGYTMSAEETYFCQFCEHDYCPQCSSYCVVCEETVCLGCGGKCPHCEDFLCRNCISTCAECEGLCCKPCLEDGLCPTCKEEMENEHEEQEDNNQEDEHPGQPQTSAA